MLDPHRTQSVSAQQLWHQLLTLWNLCTVVGANLYGSDIDSSQKATTDLSMLAQNTCSLHRTLMVDAQDMGLTDEEDSPTITQRTQLAELFAARNLRVYKDQMDHMIADLSYFMFMLQAQRLV